MNRDVIDWRAAALCTQTDPELFFAEKEGAAQTVLEAKKICAQCDVREQCLKYALDNREEFGTWGGTSAKDRRKLRGPVTPPDVDEVAVDLVVHGTPTYLNYAEKLQATTILVSLGADVDRIAELLRVKRKTAIRYLREAPNRDDIDLIAIEQAAQGKPTKLNGLERRKAVTLLHTKMWGDQRIAATLHLDAKEVWTIRKELRLAAIPQEQQDQGAA
jgi:WhiB family redox-sensing transcriptional regulator